MTSSLPALLWQCQTDTETATNLTSLSLSITADWDHAADECLFQCHPSPTRKRGRCRHHHSKQHRGGLPSPPISADTHTPRAALAPCLRGTHTRTLTPQPLSQLLRVVPCEAQSQAQSSRHCASSAGNGAAAKTKRELFSFPIFENKPSLSFPAEGAGQCRREGGLGRGWEGKGFCFASEARNPQKPIRLLMRCQTPSPHPVLSRNLLGYPKWQYLPLLLHTSLQDNVSSWGNTAAESWDLRQQ